MRPDGIGFIQGYHLHKPVWLVGSESSINTIWEQVSEDRDGATFSINKANLTTELEGEILYIVT